MENKELTGSAPGSNSIAHKSSIMKPYAGTDLLIDSGLTKREIEEAHIRGVLSRLGLDGFDLTLGEAPDAHITFSTKSVKVHIGIEHTTIQSDAERRGSALKRFRTKWTWIANRVDEALANAATSAPYCVVEFSNPSYDCLEGVELSNVVEELVVAGKLLLTSKTVSFPLFDTPLLNRILLQIRVVDPHGDRVPWWPSHMQSGEIPEMDDTIRQRIAEKAQKTYNWGDAAERWLLLVAEGHGLTDVIGRARPIVLHPFSRASPFTSILIHDRFSEDVWSVWPAYSQICDGSNQFRHVDALPSPVRPFVRDGSQYPTRPKQR